jgi:two-component system response regulator FlrC
MPLRTLSQPRRASSLVKAPAGAAMSANWRTPLHRAVLLAQGVEIGTEAMLTPEGETLGPASGRDVASRAAQTAEAVTRGLVGRTVADVERDLILDTLDHCLGNRTHAAKILGISIRTLRNKLNQYADEGMMVPEPGEKRGRGLVIGRGLPCSPPP